jgi:hypothetical protein
MLCREGEVADGVRESKQAAIALGGELEAKRFLAPDPSDAPRRRELDDLTRAAFAFKDLAQLRPPVDRGGKPARKLGGLGDRSPDALDRVIQASLDA